MAKLDWALEKALKKRITVCLGGRNMLVVDLGDVVKLIEAERRRAVRVVEKALVWGPNRVGVMVRNPGTQEVWIRRADILAKLKEGK